MVYVEFIKDYNDRKVGDKIYIDESDANRLIKNGVVKLINDTTKHREAGEPLKYITK
jgi:hypothetical protein